MYCLPTVGVCDRFRGIYLPFRGFARSAIPVPRTFRVRRRTARRTASPAAFPRPRPRSRRPGQVRAWWMAAAVSSSSSSSFFSCSSCCCS